MGYERIKVVKVADGKKKTRYADYAVGAFKKYKESLKRQADDPCNAFTKGYDVVILEETEKEIKDEIKPLYTFNQGYIETTTLMN